MALCVLRVVLGLSPTVRVLCSLFSPPPPPRHGGWRAAAEAGPPEPVRQVNPNLRLPSCLTPPRPLLIPDGHADVPTQRGPGSLLASVGLCAHPWPPWSASGATALGWWSGPVPAAASLERRLGQSSRPQRGSPGSPLHTSALGSCELFFRLWFGERNQHINDFPPPEATE